MRFSRVLYQVGGVVLVGAAVMNLPIVAYGQFSPDPSEPGNTLTPGTIDISLSAGAWQPVGQELDLEPGEQITKDIILTNGGSIDVQWVARVAQTGGDDAFCQALQAYVLLDGIELYSDALLELDVQAPQVLLPGAQQNWEVQVNLLDSADPVLSSKQCRFDLSFGGTSGGGLSFLRELVIPTAHALFSDTEVDSNIIQAGEWSQPIPARSLYGIPVEFEFLHDLKKDDYSYAVRYLQIILNSDPETLVVSSPHQHGSPGYETTAFGDLTEEAVARFQDKYEIAGIICASIPKDQWYLYGCGKVGPATRNVLNEKLSPLDLYNDLLDKEGRGEAISTALDLYLTSLVPEFSEAGLVLAALINESAGITYNNEWVRPNGPHDFGRGIMQVTTDIFVGMGAGGCGQDNSCNACMEQDNVEYQCSKYYTNTLDGIKRNVSDGLFALQQKYNESNCDYRYNQEEHPGVGIEDIFIDTLGDLQLELVRVAEHNGFNSQVRSITGPDGVLSCSIGDQEFRSIDSLWRYNGRITSRFQGLPCTGIDYLGCIADHLEAGLVEGQFGYVVPNVSDWVTKVRMVNQRPKLLVAIKSPGELYVEDLVGRVTGLVDGLEKEEIPFSYYDPDSRQIGSLLTFDGLKIKVRGTDSGEYGLDLFFSEDDASNALLASGVPISSGTVHTYTIEDQGEVKIDVDIDGDGDGEYEFTVSDTLDGLPLSIEGLLRDISNIAKQAGKDKLFKGYEWANITRSARHAWRDYRIYGRRLKKGREQAARSRLESFYENLDEIEEVVKKLSQRDDRAHVADQILPLIELIRLNSPKM